MQRPYARGQTAEPGEPLQPGSDLAAIGLEGTGLPRHQWMLIDALSLEPAAVASP